jgi:hypothetical protein
MQQKCGQGTNATTSVGGTVFFPAGNTHTNIVNRNAAVADINYATNNSIPIFMFYSEINHKKQNSLTRFQPG